MGTRDCSPRRPVAVIHFHGTQDQFAPFEGGTGSRSVSRTQFYSVVHSIQAWVGANGCPPEPTVERLPDRADDSMTVIRKTYGPGKEGSEVVLLEIEGGGHTWPGREPTVRWLGARFAHLKWSPQEVPASEKRVRSGRESVTRSFRCARSSSLANPNGWNARLQNFKHASVAWRGTMVQLDPGASPKIPSFFRQLRARHLCRG